MKYALTRTQFKHLYWSMACAFILTISAVQALAGELDNRSGTNDSQIPAWSSPLTFFQRVISRADGDRCPMYPSCSHYAKTVFERYNPVTAWILSCDRLLRCGHDEVRLAPRVYVNGKAHAYDPVTANTFWWHQP